MPESRPQILIVEDETHLAAGIKLNFELDGYEVQVAESVRQANLCMEATPSMDVIILDVMLPDASGFEFCRSLRNKGNFTPVLMLTALGETEERVRGLEAGADDYMVKPFELSELRARVRSMLRRRHWERDDSIDEGESNHTHKVESLTIGDCVVDLAAQELRMGDHTENLTRLECDLLRYFAAHPGRVLSRSELQQEVWKLPNYSETRMVDNFIARLRKYFERDTSNPRYFVSVRGSGYKFVPDSEA